MKEKPPMKKKPITKKNVMMTLDITTLIIMKKRFEEDRRKLSTEVNAILNFMKNHNLTSADILNR
jgi:hypothetical protein